jgi:hypothetical protein
LSAAQAAKREAEEDWGKMKRREQLAQIESHIAQCEALIARHHEIIRNAHQKGRDASWAKDTLKALYQAAEWLTL